MYIEKIYSSAIEADMFKKELKKETAFNTRVCIEFLSELQKACSAYGIFFDIRSEGGSSWCVAATVGKKSICFIPMEFGEGNARELCAAFLRSAKGAAKDKISVEAAAEVAAAFAEEEGVIL